MRICCLAVCIFTVLDVVHVAFAFAVRFLKEVKDWIV